jgi:hypothetical protein
MNEDDKKIFEGIDKPLTAVPPDVSAAMPAFTVGTVVNTDDPLQMGRLQVFCPTLNDDPKKLLHLPWAAYASPFAGVVNNTSFTRGSDPENCTTRGAVHYGFWAIPLQGAHVLVGCIDGDVSRRFWMGCLSSHQETHTLFNGRFKWAGGKGIPDGPLSSAGEKIQPLYDNQTEAFGNRTSAEWRTRGADFQATAVSGEVGEVPNETKKTYLDDSHEQITNSEPEAWVKDVLGAHGYDWTSFKNLGPFLSSKVYGITSPGFHTLALDDRAFNSRVKIRSSGGHAILLDDTNERIYIATNKGNNWIEMDSNGNIDVYSKRRVSVHAEDDINFSTGGSFRVKAAKGIYMYAGNTAGSPLPDVPPDGQIRLHANDDMHLYSNKNIREFAGQKIFLEATSDIHVKSVNWNQHTTSNVNIDAGSSINLEAQAHILAAVSSSLIQVDSSKIINKASNDVYFSGGGVQGSISSIDDTFKHKQDNSGSPMDTKSTSPVSPPSITVNASDAQISVWTNRVPQHEPWPRGLKQNVNKPINAPNDGYKNNTAWVDQFNGQSSSGNELVGKVEGDQSIERGPFWRR